MKEKLQYLNPLNSFVISTLSLLALGLTSCDNSRVRVNEMTVPPTIAKDEQIESKFLDSLPEKFRSARHYAVLECDLNSPKDCDIKQAKTTTFVATIDGKEKIILGEGKDNLKNIIYKTSFNNPLKIVCLPETKTTEIESDLNSSCILSYEVGYPYQKGNSKYNPNLINIMVNDVVTPINRPNKN
jgi:hypothetical protein